MPQDRFKNGGVLSGVDLSLSIDKEEYKRQVDKAQKNWSISTVKSTG